MKTMPSDVPLRSKKLLCVGSCASFDSRLAIAQKMAMTTTGRMKTKRRLLTGHLPFRQNYGIARIVIHGRLGTSCRDFRPAVAAYGH